MTSRRRDDPDTLDPTNLRGDNPELGLSWNGKGVKARGLGVLVLLIAFLIVGSNLYAGYRIEQAIVRTFDSGSEQHRTIKISQDRTSCIVAMSADERDRFRSRYAPGAFKQACPWVDE